MSNAAGHLLGVGQCLNEAKTAGLVPHGEWEAWVHKNTGFSLRQAQRMMNAARQVPEGSAMAQLPFTKIQACLQLPSAEERESMAQRVQAEDMSLRDLQEEVRKANEQAEAAKKRQLQAEGNLRSHVASAANERKRLLDELKAAKDQAAQPVGSGGISPEIREQIDKLRFEVAEAEAEAERQAELRQQAQQELLNHMAAEARGDTAGGNDTGMDFRGLSASIREFVSTAGVLPHLGMQLAQAPEGTRQEIRACVDMVADWVEGARSALQTVCVD